MRNDFIDLLEKPQLWARSDAPFWDDEHISKGMLKAHLNPDWDAASRKTETIERSVCWLSEKIPLNSNVLDLGCGPGLYCKRLSAIGYNMTGFDISKCSVEYAKNYDDRTRYICGNYLKDDYCGLYDVILMIYCDYAALTLPERQALLARVEHALKPGGVFIFDVFTDTHFKKKKEVKEETDCPNGGFWSPFPYTEISATYLYENNTVAVDRSIIITENNTVEYLVWDTAFNPERLNRELNTSGFTISEYYGDVCGKVYDKDSETLCAIAAKNS